MGIFTYDFLSIQFFPTECPGPCQHRPGHSIGGKYSNVMFQISIDIGTTMDASYQKWVQFLSQSINVPKKMAA